MFFHCLRPHCSRVLFQHRTFLQLSTAATQSDTDAFGSLDSRFTEKHQPKPKKPSMPRVSPDRTSLRASKTKIGTSPNQSKWRDSGSYRRFQGQFRKGSGGLNPEDSFGSLDNASSFEQSINLAAMKKNERRTLGPAVRKEKQEERMRNRPDPEESDDEGVVEFRPFYIKHPPDWYAEECTRLGNAGHIAECVAMLEKRMLKEDRVPPTERNFGIVLRFLGKAGQSKKAFEILKLMRKHGISVGPREYTSVWNACANAPFSEQALSQTCELLQKAEQLGVNLNPSHYRVLIKAFGRHGDIESCFKIMDKMIQAGFSPDPVTYTHLIQAAVSDKDAGFSMAIRLWRRMLSERHQPNIFAFNSLLRACRDCNFGDESTMLEILQINRHSVDALPESSRSTDEIQETDRQLVFTEGASSRSLGYDRTVNPEEPLVVHENSIDHNEAENSLLPSSGRSVQDPIWSQFLACLPQSASYSPDHVTVMEVARPRRAKELARPLRVVEKGSAEPTVRNHVLHPSYRPHSAIQINTSELSSSIGRFALLGGVQAFLAMMRSFNCRPDIKTFTLMLSLIPDNEDSENNLLKMMELSSCLPDIDFYNLLMRRKGHRGDAQGAVALLKQMFHQKMEPTEVTFGCLAVSCTSAKIATALIRDMQQYGLKPNIQICSALLSTALRTINFHYATDIINTMDKFKIQPNQRFMTQLTRNLARAADRIAKLDAGLISNEFYEKKGDEFQLGYSRFKKRLTEWSEKSLISENEDPWKELDNAIDKISSDHLRHSWERPWERQQQPKYE